MSNEFDWVLFIKVFTALVSAIGLIVLISIKVGPIIVPILMGMFVVGAVSAGITQSICEDRQEKLRAKSRRY